MRYPAIVYCDSRERIPGDIQGKSGVEEGFADSRDNILKNGPHTSAAIARNDWSHPYSRQKAAFPVKSLSSNKFWPGVGRINESYGDRNLFCACPPMESWKP